MAEKMTVEKAKEFMMGQGFHCSQCVLSHTAELGGLDKDLALQLSGGLGGGCFHGDTCGAISAAVITLSMVYGFHKPYSAEQNAKMVEKLGEFEQRFLAKHGSLLCRDLLGGYDFSKPGDSEKIMAGGAEGVLKNCATYCTDVCDILDDMLKDEA